MIDYDSFSRCHLTDIFFAFHAGAKELKSHRAGGCILYEQIILMTSQQRDYWSCLFRLRISLIAACVTGSLCFR